MSGIHLWSIAGARNIPKLICYLSFSAICFSQCFLIVMNYFEYPDVIDMYEVSPDPMTILPGVTICNSNRLSLKKVLRNNETLRKAFNEKFSGEDFNSLKSRLEPHELTKFRDGLLRIYDDLGYDAQRDMDRMTMNEAYAYKPDNPFRWFGCARTWTNSIECDHLTHIESIQDRKCTTILHKGAMMYDQIHKPHLFNSTLPRAETTYNYFREVIRIMIDFEPEDYADLRRQIGGRMIIHPAEHVGTSDHRNFYLARGYRYDFHLDRQETKRDDSLQYKCFNYGINLDAFKEKLDPRVPLYGATCLQNCIARNVIHRSHCWPNSMPYYRNDSLDPGLKLKPCIWSRDPQYLKIVKETIRVENMKKMKSKGLNVSRIDETNYRGSKIFEEGPRNYTRIRRFCWISCSIPCTVTDYKISMTRSAWPKEVEISLNRTGREKFLRHCCALITVKYSHFHYNVQQFMPKYNLIETIGNLGGLLAVWLGISIVSAIHTLQKLAELCQRRMLSSIRVRDVEYHQ